MSRKKNAKLTQALLTEEGQVLIKNSDGTYRAAKSETDWQRLRSMSDEAVEKIARADNDNPPMTDEEWANAARVPIKIPISLRVDDDVLEFFKSQGKGYQTRMCAVLRAYMNAHKDKRVSS